MGQYTEYLYGEAETLNTDDEQYAEKLLEIADLFRDFGTALTEYLIEHGYTGDRDSARDKAKYLRKCYDEAEVTDLPRDFKTWFDSKPQRETTFPLLFALRLDLKESDDFFRRVRLERSFDRHTASEAVYYFCIKHQLPYSQAKEAIKKVSAKGKEKISAKGKEKIPKQDALYTSAITEELENLTELSEVITYICENSSDFEYTHVTAVHLIQELWNEISSPDGIAIREGILLGNDRSEDGRVTAADSLATWTIFAQIVDLDHRTEKKYSRTIAPALKMNPLTALAADDFPNRQTIDAVRRGESKNHEAVRKLLIMLVFYEYWAKLEVKHMDLSRPASKEERERFMATINDYLQDAGYPELYPGNPYDWIFLWSLNDEKPLSAFRSFFLDMFAADSETPKV